MLPVSAGSEAPREPQDRAGLGDVARGGTLNLAGAALSAAATLGVTIAVTRAFTRPVAGAFFAATSLFLIMATVANLGAYNGLIYFIAQLRSLRSRGRVPALLRAAVVPVVVASLIGTAVLFLLARPLADLLLGGHLGRGVTPSAVAMSLRGLAITLPFAALLETYLGASRGYRDMRPTVVVDRIGRSGLQLLGVSIAAATGSAALLAPLWALPYVPAGVLAWVWFHRVRQRAHRLAAVADTERSQLREVPADRRTGPGLAGFWRFNAPRALATLAQMTIQRLDIVLVGILRGPVEAAIYTAATRFLVVGQLGNSALSMAAQPQFTHLFAIGDRRGANSVYQVTTGWLILLTWPLYLLAAVYGPTVLVIFGHSYRAGSTVMVILGLAMLVATGCGQVDMVLTTTGRTSWSLLNGLAAVAVNVGIDLALIPHYGITGAAIGWAAAIAVTNLVPLAQVATAVRVHPFGKGTLIACVLTTISFGIIPLTLRSLAGGQLMVTAIAVAIGCVALAAGAWQFREPLQLALLPGFPRLTARRMLAGGVAAGLVAVAAAGAVLLLRQHQHQHAPRPGATSPASGRLADRFPGTNLALVPAGGAYLGAYVQPAEYTSRGTIAAMRGFERSVGHPVDLVHVYDQWEKPFPTAADRFFVRHGKVLLLTWGGSPDTKAIIAGRDDAMIRARADAVKRLGRPILMEFRHEMDRPNLQWTIHGPASYIKAWDHVRAIFTAAGATNVSWVWCPTGFGFEKGRAQAFYPGDSEVDWVCADVYANSTAQPLRAAAGPFLSWARHTRKPVIIGEFAVKGNSGGWGTWLAAAGKLARSDRQIRAMAYFDGNGFDSNGHPFAYRLDHRPRALRVFGRLLGQPFFQPRAP